MLSSKAGKHNKTKKIKCEPTKADKESHVSTADRALHKRLSAEVKAKLEAKGKSTKGVETFEAFYAMLKSEAVALQKEYQPKLRNGINITVDLINQVQKDKKDGDVDIKVKIAPNNEERDIVIDISKDEEAGIAPFYLHDGWDGVKAMEQITIKVEGNGSVSPHIFDKHGPERSRADLIESINKDITTVKNRVDARKTEAISDIATFKDSIESAFTTLEANYSNIGTQLKSVVNTFLTIPSKANKDTLTAFIKAQSYSGEEFLAVKAFKKVLTLNAPKLFRAHQDVELFNKPEGERNLEWWTDAKKRVDLKVIQYKASKFNDEATMKAKVEEALSNNQDKINTAFEGKKIGVTHLISTPVAANEEGFFSGVTFDQNMNVTNLTTFSKVVVILMNYKKGAPKNAPDKGTGRFILKTAYPQQ